MFGSKKVRKKDLDEQLLTEIFKVKKEWGSIKSIVERSVEPSESGIFDLSVAEVKYFYLLREARHRKISALR